MPFLAPALPAILGGVASSVAGHLLGGGSSSGGQASSAQRQVYDPYGPYRGAAATQLNALMADPSKVQQLPEWAAMQQAASRTIAAQGYTGSGNALVASANAGGQAYQQAFNNLAMLSGAGQSPAYAAAGANQQAMGQQQQQNGLWSTLGNDIGHWFGGGGSSSGQGGYGGYNASNYSAAGGTSGYNISAGGGGGGGKYGSPQG